MRFGMALIILTSFVGFSFVSTVAQGLGDQIHQRIVKKHDLKPQ